ncbi:dephospho-CoA kinase [uncultured Sunxiuqinia sp.]|uniref:dephospho-CoA kinase n=1 Tax=uncultured Sunxiuqinia sp. TaxID=1573825 RepID=UPI002AA676B0|nr:dephospho-CoA kinase [uncultured Sunxiuqinia sp.]
MKNKNIYKVGITGGIGSGKTTICNFFKTIGIPVFSADLEAKRILNESSQVRSQMIFHFGKDIYLSNHTVDRKKLADIIFNSPSLLKKVNSIIHPEVRKFFFEWCNRQNSAYIVHEAAILFESGFYEMMDFNILVIATEQQRIEWVMKRDNSTAEQIKERISKQWPDEKKIQLANMTIDNNNRELIVPILLELDKKFRLHG